MAVTKVMAWMERPKVFHISGNIWPDGLLADLGKSGLPMKLCMPNTARYRVLEKKR